MALQLNDDDKAWIINAIRTEVQSVDINDLEPASSLEDVIGLNEGDFAKFPSNELGGAAAGAAVREQMKQLFLAADPRPSTNPLKLKFNGTTGYYEMNGLTDLTFNDMLMVYATANLTNHPYQSGFGYALMRTQARTNYPTEVTGWSDTVDVSVRAMCVSSLIEVCVLTGNETGAQNNVIAVNDALWFLNDSRRLKAFLNPIRIKTSSALRYAGQSGNEVLERIYLQIQPNSGQTNFVTGGLFRSANIKYECFRYLVDNSTTSSTATATVSVNATTYEYLTGESEPTEAVGGTSAQWQQLVTDGAEKGITFVAL